MTEGRRVFVNCNYFPTLCLLYVRPTVWVASLSRRNIKDISGERFRIPYLPEFVCSCLGWLEQSTVVVLFRAVCLFVLVVRIRLHPWLSLFFFRALGPSQNFSAVLSPSLGRCTLIAEESRTEASLLSLTVILNFGTPLSLDACFSGYSLWHHVDCPMMRIESC